MTQHAPSATTWIVRRSAFPFSIAPEAVGTVTGHDKADAQQKAEDHYGRDVTVERAHGARLGPADFDPGQLGSRRLMTADEVTMARALGCCRAVRAPKLRGMVRLLHAETYKQTPTISELQAGELRAAVRALASRLEPSVVELAGGAA